MISQCKYIWTEGARSLKSQERASDLFFSIGSLPITFAFLCFSTANLGFVFHQSISEWHFCFSLFITFIIGFFVGDRRLKNTSQRWFNFGLASVVFAIVLLSSILISDRVYDISWDGQYYQQEGIVQLKQGWNPVFQELSLRKQTMFVNHYPKAPWIEGAVLYRFSGQIEAGKAFNLMFLASSFWFCLSAFFRWNFAPRHAILFSSVSCLNPVTLYQSLSFCIDGQLASLLTSSLAIFAVIFKRSNNKFESLILLFAICLLVNTKFTGILYSLVLGGGFILLLLLDRQFQKALAIAKVGLSSLFLGVSLLGYHPYMTNTLNYHHPFYPLRGANAVEIMEQNMPIDFQNLNRFEKLFRSLFSRSANLGSSYTRETTHLKIPFLFYGESELAVFREENPRVAGFGVLFSGALLMSFLTGAIALTIDLKKTTVALFITGILFVSGLINPEAWWARYVPQFWLIPIIFSILTLQLPAKYTKLKFLGWSTLALLSINLYLIFCVYFFHNFKTTSQMNYQLKLFQKNNVTLLVDFSYFWSNRIRLQERGVLFREVPRQDLPCPNPVPLIGAPETRYCIKSSTSG